MKTPKEEKILEYEELISPQNILNLEVKPPRGVHSIKDKKIKSISNYGQNVTFTYVNESKETISSSSRDDDVIIKCALFYLRNNKPKIL